MVRVDRHGYLKAVADADAKRESLTARLGFEIEHLGTLIAEDLSKLDYCNSLGSPNEVVYSVSYGSLEEDHLSLIFLSAMSIDLRIPMPSRSLRNFMRPRAL
uniref:Uncharacterized protein n=1 Tax=Physcomitrium patens TaxID=3218 RepID=A0A7I3YWC6_PHYPA